MEYKKIGNKYIVRIDRGEEIVESIKQLCRENGITSGTVSGIGAVNRAVIGLFDTAAKKYHSKEFSGDHEVTSLYGNISTLNNEVYLHLHVNLADTSLATHGGHLNSAVVSGTGEIVIEAFEGKVDREYSEEIGLNLYKFSKKD